ncbi:hypothetical protein ACOMHN_003764 [Nucella lapillus]
MGKGGHGGGEEKKKKKGITPVAPPDGGWGWVVVLSSFLIHVIADGIVYSFGVIMVYLVDYFQSGRGETSWVGSLQPAVTFTVGPLASALTNRYGCRVVTIVGAIISAAGFVLSVFTPNLYFLYFSSGIMADRLSFALSTGLGFGLIYLPAIVSVAQYFEKRRSFATGLAVCGSGFGTFAMAPITKLLVEEYSWRGTMLILGGVILNVTVCGAVFRPLEASSADSSEDGEKGENEKNNGLKTVPENEALLGEKVNNDGFPNDMFLDNFELEIKVTDFSKSSECGGGGDTSTLPLNSGKQVALISNSDNDLAPHVHNEANSINIAKIAKSDGALHRLRKSPHHQRGRRFVRQQSITATNRPVGRKDVFYTGSLQNIPMYRSHRDLYITSITSLGAKQGEEEVEESSSKCCGITVPSEFREAFQEMMDFSLLKNPVFLMFAISNFFTSIGFNMPFIFLPDRAKLVGIDEERAAWLLSTIGITNTLGRVVFGFMADLKWVNRLMLYNTALTICGLATALSPFVGGNYELLMTYAAVFGIFIGVYVSLTSVVLVDLLGIDLLTNSFGLLLLFQGAATFIGPPLAGWMCDWTGSYDISFNVMGSLIAVSGAMLYLLPMVQRRYRRNMLPERREHEKVMGVRSTEESSSTDEEINLELSRKTSL